MPLPIAQITAFEHLGGHLMRVSFSDGRIRRINLLPALNGEPFQALREKQLFASVRLDPEYPALVWPNGATLDAAALQQWIEEELVAPWEFPKSKDQE